MERKERNYRRFEAIEPASLEHLQWIDINRPAQAVLLGMLLGEVAEGVESAV